MAVRVMVRKNLQSELHYCSAMLYEKYVNHAGEESRAWLIAPHTSYCYNIYLHHYEADDGQHSNHAQSSDAAGKGRRAEGSAKAAGYAPLQRCKLGVYAYIT